jgi:predicted ATP-grasp superfamily ATP-dependent carboligase
VSSHLTEVVLKARQGPKIIPGARRYAEGMALYEFVADVPDLVAPALVVAFDGWVNAGSVGTGAAESIASSGTPLAVFDGDVLFDYRSSRPDIEFVEGVMHVTRWPEITLTLVHHQRDLLVLTGNEPDFRWRALSASIGEIGRSLGVVEMVSLGGVPAAVPHTRPVRILTTASRKDLIPGDEQLPQGTLKVPGAAVNIVEQALTDQGIPAVGFWAQIPHYVAGPFYGGAIALIERAARHLGIDVPLGSLVDDAAQQRRELDATVADKPEALAYVRRLEEIVGSQQTVPSGEEIAQEVERFLRENTENPFGDQDT